MGHPPVLRAEMRERSTERPESLPAPPTAPTSQEAQQKPKYSTRTPGLCPDLSWPLTGDHHMSPADKDQTEAQTPKPQKPRTSERRNKAVSRGATWRRPVGLPLSLVSEIAAISGVRDGHRNRKNRCDFGALRFCKST